MVNIQNIGSFEEKYSMLFRNEVFTLLGKDTNIRVKFNCIKTKKVTDSQISNYLYLKENITKISQIIEYKLKEYAANKGCKDISECGISSVEFSSNCSFFLADVPWDEEQGIAILFDNTGVIKIVEADDIL